MFRLILAIPLIVSCGHKTKKDTPTQTEKIEEIYNQKLEELKTLTISNRSGWPSDSDCDAALWAGIARRAGAEWVDISAALTSEGRPTRKPSADCSVPDESKATTSNDMILGIMIGLFASNDSNSLLRLYIYGKTNAWIMGQPENFISRVLLRTNGRSLLARALAKISDNKFEERLIPIAYAPGVDDFEAHLQFLSLMFQRDVGDPTNLNESVVQQTCKANPKDALADVICGLPGRASDLLLGDYEYPSYVRGHEHYKLVHWLLVAKLILED